MLGLPAWRAPVLLARAIVEGEAPPSGVPCLREPALGVRANPDDGGGYDAREPRRLSGIFGNSGGGGSRGGCCDGGGGSAILSLGLQCLPTQPLVTYCAMTWTTKANLCV